jgi:hypothetical protein
MRLMSEPKPEYKTTHGGRREGAGRKPRVNGDKRLSLSLSDEQYEHLVKASKAAGVSIAVYIRSLIDRDRAT